MLNALVKPHFVISLMMSTPPFFAHLMSNVSRASSSQIYSEYALARFIESDPVTSLTHLANYLQNMRKLDSFLLAGVRSAIHISPSQNDLVHNLITMIINSLDCLCQCSDEITYYDEIKKVCDAIFAKDNQFSQFVVKNKKKYKIFILFLLMIEVEKGKKTETILESNFKDVLGNKTFDGIFEVFTFAAFLEKISEYACQNNELLPYFNQSVCCLISYFLKNKNMEVIQFFPKILENLKLENDLRRTLFMKLITLNNSHKNLSVDIIHALISLRKCLNDDEIKNLIESLLKITSLIPIPFIESMADEKFQNRFDAVMNGLKCLIQDNEKIGNLIIKNAKSKKADKRIRYLYCINSLVKIKVKFDESNLRTLFEGFETCFEACALSEILLNLIENGIEIMEWDKTVLFLENAFLVSDEKLKKCILETASGFGNSLNIGKVDFLNFITWKISSSFKNIILYLEILNSYMKKGVQIEDFPSALTVNILVYYQLSPHSNFSNLSFFYETDILNRIDANYHSVAFRAMIKNFLDNYHIKDIITSFLIKLTPRCSIKEATYNTIICYDLFSDNTEKISSMYAAFVSVDLEAAMKFIHAHIFSMAKKFGLFSISNTKDAKVSEIVFKTLSKLDKNNQQFLFFASEFLPNLNDIELCSYVLNSLAETFRNNSITNQEFPQKCRLFDFIISVSKYNYDDSFKCIGTLLPIPPINKKEQFPIIINIILQAKVISDDLIFVLETMIKLCDSLNDIQTIITPLIKNIKDEKAYSILLSILNTLSGSEINDEDDFKPLKIGHSITINIFKHDTKSFDLFLECLSETVGICLPLYEKYYYAVHFILRIIGILTQKDVDKHIFSLKESINYISMNFNSKCLLNIVSFLCKNLTASSVTSFLLLIRNRESELLHFAQQFAANLLMTKNPNFSFLFEVNENLAKTATSLLNIDDYEILKNAIKASNYRKSIFEVLKDSLVERSSLLQHIIHDKELTEYIDIDEQEKQFVLILTEGVQGDITLWDKEKTLHFLNILEQYIPELSKGKKLSFAFFVSNIEDTDCISKSISIFSKFFQDIDFTTCFSTSVKYLPVLIQTNHSRPNKLYQIISISLQNENSLPYILNVLHLVINYLLISTDLIYLLTQQKEVKSLHPFLPLILSAFMNEDPEINKQLALLVSKIIQEDINPPTSFIELLDLCKKIQFNDITPEIIESLLKRSMKNSKTDSLCSLIILSMIISTRLVSYEKQKTVIDFLLNLYSSSSEESQNAAIVGLSCFKISQLL